MNISHAFSKLQSQPKPYRFLASRLLAKTGQCTRFTIPQDGFKLHFQPASVPMTLWVDPHALDEGTGFLKTMLRPNDTFVDVGANVGQLAIQAAVSVQNQQNIVCIEAHPTTYGYLCENLALNRLGGVNAIHCAVGADEGSVKFTSKYSDDQNEISATGDVEVPLKKLDQLVSLPAITLLKIDVEGFELFVLQGAHETLARTEAVYFEAWDPLFAKHNYSFADVAAIFHKSGFALYSVDGIMLTPFHQTASPDFTNLLALRSEDFAVSRGFRISR